MIVFGRLLTISLVSVKLRTPSLQIVCLAALLLSSIGRGNPVLGQKSTDPVSFEVVSVKPSAPDCALVMIGPSEDGFHLHCLSLLLLVQYAYNLNPFEDGHVLGLPAWGGGARFDLDAPVQSTDRTRFDALSPPEKAMLLRPALAERFGLRTHEEQREMPVYSLIKGKSAPKLKPADPDNPVAAQKPTLIRRGRGRLEAYHCTMHDFLSFISPLRGRSIVDRTGLSGSYDFSLDYTPETNTQPAPEDDAAPSIFTAVQEQLGLRLVSDKALQPVVIVDAASRPEPN
jgi:uncharacterized protein (TIGR03435 family)